jgi:hypothetical protein
VAPAQSPESGNYQNMTSAPQLPNYLGLPFRILVSPFVNFDPENRVTDIMMFNSRNRGALIVDEDPHVKSWEDGQYNIMNMSIEETYGFGILNEGQAIAVAKNVKIRPNEFVMPARTDGGQHILGLSVLWRSNHLARGHGPDRSHVQMENHSPACRLAIGRWLLR